MNENEKNLYNENEKNLYRCQQLIADLRAVMAAATAVLHQMKVHDVADLIWEGMGTDDRAAAARHALEEEAGYVVPRKAE